MVAAYSELISPTGELCTTGKITSNGAQGVVKVGQSVECVVDKLYYRQPVAYADESQKFLIEQGLDMQDGEFPSLLRLRLVDLSA
jgi:hypothetical protein